MRKLNTIAAAALASALIAPACNRPQPAEDGVAATREGNDPDIREREDDVAELDTRVMEIDRKWNEMEAKVKEEGRTPTAGLREEVREDVVNVKEAIQGLRTTTAANWWERHERATERTLEDIEADVQRFAKGTAARVRTENAPVGTGGFEQRRDAWIGNARTRLDAMEARLQDVDVEGALATELQDTRARIDKLQDDLDRLSSASAEDWWDVSATRVREYVDRVERSIGRLDNDTQ